MSRGSSIIIKITNFKSRKKERREETEYIYRSFELQFIFYKMNLEPLAYLAVVTSYGL